MNRLRLILTAIALGAIVFGSGLAQPDQRTADASGAVGGDSLTVAAQPASGTVDSTSVALVAGGNLIGWFGLDTTSATILDGNADLTTVWVFGEDGWAFDSTLLPRPNLLVSRGMGLFIVTSAATNLAVPTGNTFSTDVFPFSDPTMDLGDATFTRTLDGASISAEALALVPGNAYTMWWVIWNDPTQCAVACGEPDLGVRGNAVLFASGAIASEAGTASFASGLIVGGLMPGGPIPGALTDPINATIHLVLRDHGPALTGDALIAQITSFEPTADDATSVGDGFGLDVQAAVNEGPNTFNTDVFPFEDPTQDLGDASFTRTLSGAAISAEADSLIPGNAYTMWWVIWNDPSQCAAACGEPDLGVSGNVVLLADGVVASDAGTASFAASLSVGGTMPDGPIPGPLTDPLSATIHLVLRDHGPALEGDALTAQLTTFEPTAADAASVGDGFAFDVQAAVNEPPAIPLSGLTAAIAAVDGSALSGVATLSAAGDGTAIQVTVEGLSEGDHANHVHHGSCADAELGAIHVPLSDLSAGADGDASGATVWPDNGLDHFASNHYVAVHELVTFAVIGCGDVS